MAKSRVRILEEVAAEVLVASAHTCCKCEERGAPVQIHHIDENPANNDPTNLAVLCLRCHDETQTTGGFARKLSAADVRLYRDNWVARVARRRLDADAIFVRHATGPLPQPTSTASTGLLPKGKTALAGSLTPGKIESYIDELPDIRSEAYGKVRHIWFSGNTIEINRSIYSVIEVVQRIWLQLAGTFPKLHFDGLSPYEYLDQYLEQRYVWHHALAEPHGRGTGGTIVSQLVNKGVLRDLEIAVVDMVRSIWGLGHSASASDAWLARWKATRITRP